MKEKKIRCSVCGEMKSAKSFPKNRHADGTTKISGDVCHSCKSRYYREKYREEKKELKAVANTDTLTVIDMIAKLNSLGYVIVKREDYEKLVNNKQDWFPDSEKLTVFDVIELCKIRDGQHKGIEKNIAKRLEEKNCIEKHGKTNAQFYTLARHYYEIAGKAADYSKLVDWNADQLLAVLAPYLEKYGKAKKSDIQKVVGDHVTDKQLRNFLEQLKSLGLIKTEGEKGRMMYMLGEKYKQQSDILTMALNIGLEVLKGNGDIEIEGKTERADKRADRVL